MSQLKGRTALERGAAFMVGSALSFASMSVAVKLASRELPNSMIVFLRSAVALVLLLPWLWRNGPRALRTERHLEHAIRGLGGLGSMYCGFYALGHLRLADAVLLNYSLPLMLPLVERAWLKVEIERRLWLPLGVGFLGLLLILKPGTSVFQPVALFGLGSALCAAVAQVGIRGLTASEPVTRIVFYFALYSTSVAALPLPFTWRTPSAPALVAALVAGLCATCGQFCLTRAYTYAPAQQIGPFIYLTVVFSGLIDWLIWHALPDGLFLAGAGAVVGAAVLTLRLRHAPPAGTA